MFRAFLAAAAAVLVVSHRVRLGQMQTDAQGVWSIDFRVPKIRPGLPMVSFLCVPPAGTRTSAAPACTARGRESPAAY